MKRFLPVLATIGLLSLTNAAKTYSEDQGYQAMYYAGAAYCEENSVKSWTCGEACTAQATTEVSVIENYWAGTFGFTGYNSETDTIVLSFRGSVDIANWMTNINYNHVDYPYGSGAQVHEGFYQAYTGVQDQVITQIQALISSHPSASLLVTGHSLGASLATFAALDLKNKISNFPNDFHFYTFGSPRCGNQEFSDYLNTVFGNGAYSRVTHYNDAVPHLPLDIMGFNHGGNEVWYNKDGYELGYVECENTAGKTESHDCSDSFLINTGISNHLIYLGKDINGMCLSKATAPQTKEVTFLA